MDETQNPSQHKIYATVTLFFVGALIGFSANVAYGLAYEVFIMPSLIVPGEPQLSYGQQAMFMAVVSGALGGAIGISVALYRRRQWASGILLSLAASFATNRFTAVLWADSFSGHGADPSDNIVFVPVFFASLVILCLTIPVVLMFALANTRQEPADRNDNS